MRCATQDRVRGARQNPRRRAGGGRSGIVAAWVCVSRKPQGR
jgi:hypothetical protein